MKIIKNIIEYLIAISVIPAIVLTVVSVTELKDVRNVQYELLSEEEGIFHITPGTYDRLVENKRIKNYELESNYPLITQEEIDRGTWQIGDLKNEIIIDENGEKRIIVKIERIILEEKDVFISAGGDRVFIPKPFDSTGFFSWEANPYLIPGYNLDQTSSRNNIYVSHDTITDPYELRASLIGKPLYYELVVKNPNTMIIESRDITVTSDYVRIPKPNDFSGNPEGLLIKELREHSDTGGYVDRFEVVNNWIYVYPKGITVEELANRMVGKTLTYELAQPRLVEKYDFSKFRLVFDRNRIRVVFDVDDGYYLWEITKDDKMIPINGQYDIGGIWTVKFYVYEIQQPMIRTLVLLIPLIVISGLLFYSYNLIKKKENE